MKNPIKIGSLEVICGSMFSGKSEELIRRVRRSQIAQLAAIVFKHRIDDRTTIEYIHSHSGDKLKAIALDNSSEIYNYIFDELDVIGIDEVQFFGDEIIPLIFDLVDAGKRVIVAGLDLDFRGVPFGPMSKLLALANNVTKLNAVCLICSEDAHFSQRLINGKPAQFDDPIIFIGAEESYQARCRKCYEINKRPEYKTL